MFDWIIDVMEWLGGLVILGIIIYKIVDNIYYLKYKEEHKDEDI